MLKQFTQDQNTDITKRLWFILNFLSPKFTLKLGEFNYFIYFFPSTLINMKKPQLLCYQCKRSKSPNKYEPLWHNDNEEFEDTTYRAKRKQDTKWYTDLERLVYFTSRTMGVIYFELIETLAYLWVCY